MTTAVTYTFSNATTADATQVNQNFTDVLAGLNGVDKLTTRGDLLTRNATVYSRLAVGAAGKSIITDGTDPSWGWTPVISAKSADYTVTDTDGVESIWMTTGASNRTVTLPTAADNTNRRIIITKVDSGAGACIVDGEGAETINGVTTITLTAQYGAVTVHCNGTSWSIYTTGYVNSNVKTQTISRVISNATTMTDGAPKNIGTTASITLTPGLYIMAGAVGFSGGATCTANILRAAISKTTGTMPGSDTEAVPTAGEVFVGLSWSTAAPCNVSFQPVINLPTFPLMITTTDTYFLVGYASYVVSSTPTAYGFLTATPVVS